MNKLIKLPDFCQEFEEFGCEDVKTLNNNDNVFKTILVWVKNDILHYEVKNPFCPSCKSKSVSYHGKYERKLHFLRRWRS